MKFAVYVPTIREFANAELLADLAVQAEDRGWDGCFVWDVMAPSDPLYAGPVGDPWVALAVMAARTERIRLGPMVTPLSRRRPAKVARETVTLDQLSNGRLVLGVGLGEPSDQAGEDPDPVVRAAKLDEGLEILRRLWSREPIDFTGVHHRIQSGEFLPTPVQLPRIPVWVGGLWPNRRPLRRAARWDGFFPYASDGILKPDDYRDIANELAALRDTTTPFDLVFGTTLTGDAPPLTDWPHYQDVGVTWWLHSVDSIDAAHTRIDTGPPRH